MTGVQTCALPIFGLQERRKRRRVETMAFQATPSGVDLFPGNLTRVKRARFIQSGARRLACIGLGLSRRRCLSAPSNTSSFFLPLPKLRMALCFCKPGDTRSVALDNTDAVSKPVASDSKNHAASDLPTPPPRISSRRLGSSSPRHPGSSSTASSSIRPSSSAPGRSAKVVLRTVRARVGVAKA